jgi:glycerophosphoryl diester phosphodiesterase
MLTRRAALLSAAALPAALNACAVLPDRQIARRAPLVIAHRGASGERPEHTLLAYARAIELGADYVECDLVATSDGALVCRHENEISDTTDVASRPEFRDRRTIKQIDGRTVVGWFTEDFTLAELRTLRARERLPRLRPGNAAYDGQEAIPTFDEVLGLIARAGSEGGRAVGVYPELKHPTYFRSIGRPMEPALLAALESARLNTAEAPVFIQCFEVGPLRRLRALTPVKLVQLVAHAGAPPDLVGRRTYLDLVTPAGLAEIRTYADAIGPEKTLLLPLDSQGRSLGPTSVLEDAHTAGLLVHAWTFRAENTFLPAELRRGPDAGAFGDFTAELTRIFALGVDGVFTDHPGQALPLAAAAAR